MSLALICSGNANNEVNAGPFYANTNNRAANTNTNIGAHLMQIYYKDINPASRQKITKRAQIAVLVSVRQLADGEDSVNALQNKEMKRIGNIFEDLCSLKNLNLAYLNARKGKLYTYGVLEFEKNKEDNLLKLQKDLLLMRFKTSRYQNFTINEYGKERLISRLPFYPDRIVHHLLMLKLEKIWCTIFIRDTYACIKGRGIHDGLARLKANLKDIKGTSYCLKIDVRKFYPSIDHAILKEIVRKKIKDNRLLCVLDEIIDSAPGVPIGNYLSQYFANLYLTYFDHYMKEVQEIKYFHRYADDIVVLHHDKAYLHALLINISDYFQQNLKLTVKHNYQIFPVAKRGINYLGYVIFHDHVLLRKSIKKRMFQSIQKMNNSNYKQKMSAYNGWLKYCDSINLQKKTYDMITRKFSELGIKVESDSFLGDKIKIAEVIGKEIIVTDFRLTDSVYKESKQCLTIQIELTGELKVIFTGSSMLCKQISKVLKEDFPFSATIECINKNYQFK